MPGPALGQGLALWWIQCWVRRWARQRWRCSAARSWSAKLEKLHRRQAQQPRLQCRHQQQRKQRRLRLRPMHLGHHRCRCCHRLWRSQAPRRRRTARSAACAASQGRWRGVPAASAAAAGPAAGAWCPSPRARLALWPRVAPPPPPPPLEEPLPRTAIPTSAVAAATAASGLWCRPLPLPYRRLLPTARGEALAAAVRQAWALARARAGLSRDRHSRLAGCVPRACRVGMR